MSVNADLQQSHSDSAARSLGRTEGLATAALALSLVSFVNLLGVEKALLAIVLAALALGRAGVSRARSRSLVAISFSLAYLLTIAIVLVAFHDKLAHLLRLLHELG
jgi:Na+-driven multidrug efflux pump